MRNLRFFLNGITFNCPTKRIHRINLPFQLGVSIGPDPDPSRPEPTNPETETCQKPIPIPNRLLVGSVRLHSVFSGRYCRYLQFVPILGPWPNLSKSSSNSVANPNINQSSKWPKLTVAISKSKWLTVPWQNRNTNDKS